VLFLPEFSN